MESSKPKSIHYRDFVADKELLESIISLTPEGIIGVNLDGIIVIFNEAAEKLTGWKRQEVLEGKQIKFKRYGGAIGIPKDLVRWIEEIKDLPEEKKAARQEAPDAAEKVRAGDFECLTFVL